MFSIPPSDAWREIHELNPRGWIADMMAVRGFREAWRDRERRAMQERKDDDGHEGIWHELLDDLEGEIAAETHAARKERRTA